MEQNATIEYTGMPTMGITKLYSQSNGGENERKIKVYIATSREIGERCKDLTRFVRALTFPNKESAYYYNNKGKKIYLNYES